MINLGEYLSKDKTMLIAPAWYWKTYHICQCIKHIANNNMWRRLILTHTHAGVSSLQQKFKEEKINSNCYNIETISSFAQKFVLSFLNDLTLPSQEDKQYWGSVFQRAIALFKNDNILSIVKESYIGLFVDEYQDCNLQHHEMILLLSNVLKLHILWDPLQGIFDFDGKPVDLEDKAQFSDFKENLYYLTEPKRREKHSPKLWLEIHEIRNMLIQKKDILLNKFSTIEHYIRDSRTLLQNKEFQNLIYGLSNTYESILIINPISFKKSLRLPFIHTFGRIFWFLEAIDDEDFYIISKHIDEFHCNKDIKILYIILCELFSENSIGPRFSKKKLFEKWIDKNHDAAKFLSQKFDEYIDSNKLFLLEQILLFLYKNTSVRCHRRELLYSIRQAISNAQENGISVYDWMKVFRNSVRMKWRSVDNRVVGTTLLTKWLEYDVVVILNAQIFQCYKNFYVAISRAVKKLIIIANVDTLRPYPKIKTIKSKKITPQQESLF